MNKDEVFQFNVQRVFASLARGLLSTLEDIQHTHKNNFDKLRETLPPEYQDLINMCDYWDANAQAWTRKKFLDTIGNGRRDLESLINQNQQ